MQDENAHDTTTTTPPAAAGRVVTSSTTTAQSEAIKRQVRTQFGRTAQAYVESEFHAHGPDLARMLTLAELRPTDLALDISTGGGHSALALARTLRDPFRIANTLEYLVNVMGAAGRGEQAAQLLGAAAELRESIGAPRSSVERALNEQEVAEARAVLGEEAWAAAYAAGRALSLDEAVAEALRPVS